MFFLLAGKNPLRNSFDSNLEFYKNGTLTFKNLPTNLTQNKLLDLISKMTAKDYSERYLDIPSLISDINKISGKEYSCVEKKILEKIITKTKLIGRDENINSLIELKDNLVNKNLDKRVTLLNGEPGIGKSRFIKEFSFHMKLERINVYQGISSENGKNHYEPILQILKEIIPEIRLEMLEKYGPELIKLLPDDRHLKGIIPSPVLNDEKEKLRLMVRLANFLHDTFEGKSNIIIFDNAQWLDESTLELIDYMLNHKQDSLMIIFSFREEELSENYSCRKFFDNWSSMGYVNEITLSRFNFEETGTLIKNLLGISTAPMAFCTEILRDTDGNPGFIVDTITSLYSEGKLYIDNNGEWSTDFDSDGDYSRLFLPSSIHEAVWKNINSVSIEAYEVLKLLSAFNTPILFETIVGILEMDIETVKQILSELAALNLIEEKLDDYGYTYDFTSKSIKKELYEKICPEQQKAIHDKSAQVLEEIYSRNGIENLDELVFHLLKAGKNKKALDLNIKSAERMLKLHIYAQAMAYLKKSLQISMEIDSTKNTIKIQLMLGELFRRKGENNNSFEAYYKALELATGIDDKLTIAKVKEMIGALYTRRNEFEKALELLNESLELSKEIGFIEGYLEAIRRICWVYIFKSRNSEAIEIILNSLKLYSDEKYNFYHAQLYNVLGTHYLGMTDINKALESYNKSIELFERIGEKVEISYPLNNIATVFAEFLHDNVKAREYFERSLEINITNNLVEGIASCYDNLGETCRLEDNYSKALDYYYKCEVQARESELNSLLFTVYKNIMFAYLELDEYEKAYDYLNKTKKEIDKNLEHGLDYIVFCDYSSRFYYELGSFKEAKSLAETGLSTCIKSGSQDLLLFKSTILLCEYASFFSTNHYPNISVLNELDSLLKSTKGLNDDKQRREILHKFIELLIQTGDRKKAICYLEESKALSDKINTTRLEIEYLYLQGTCISGSDGITLIEKAMELNSDYGSTRLRIKCLKAIGDIIFSSKNKLASATYYLMELESLYKLVLKVPKEYIKSFLFSHNRNVSRERLLHLKLDVLMEQHAKTEKLALKQLPKGEHLIKHFFDGFFTDTNTFNKETGQILLPDKSNIAADNPMEKIKSVLMSMSSDYKHNLKKIIDSACDITASETGYILVYSDKDDLDILIERENNCPSNFYEYATEQVKEKNEYLICIEAFGKRTGNFNIVLPGDIKAVMCLPIYRYMLNEKDRYQTNNRKVPTEKSALSIMGYIYLSTSSIQNNFSTKSVEACKILANQAALQIENYNLRIVSSIDKLTGVYTRKFFESTFELLIKKSQREKTPFSIVMIDIDKFKSVNDNFGHQKGDEILSGIGKILMENIRMTDICCRYGGEEFIILLPDTDIDEAESISEHMRNSVEKAKLMGQASNLTISLGISTYPRHGEWRDELIGKADQALYQAKETGRNKVCVWNSKMKKIINRMDKLAGIVTGNIVKDQKNVLSILEIVQIANERIAVEEKIQKLLNSLLETFGSDFGAILLVSGNSNRISKIYSTKNQRTQLPDDNYLNKKIIEKALKSKAGSYQVDWDNINSLKLDSVEQVLNSILVEPVLLENEITAILYFSCTIDKKEYGFNELNFLSVVGNILKGFILSELQEK
ncbi:MAG: Response regulator PleD [Firmicutes bacterium ADurb.Bin419]|nr:MAG: Response regulator PleD [Firmicutes bacterium ADurb.Bin419]